MGIAGLGRVMALAREPRDVASLAVYRMLFGALMCVSSLRFVLEGWVERAYALPRFHFTYWGLSFIEPLDADLMVAAYVLLAILSLLVALGLFYRASILAFFLLFTWTELIDVTNYLNHYYLVSLLSLLMVFLPMNRGLSLDARLFSRPRRDSVPAWVIGLLRFQVAIVYFFAAMAKVESDWLLHGQPLGIWLRSRTDLPVLGPLFAYPEVALLCSWAGFLNDLLAPFLLSHRRTRPFGFAMVVVFHTLTHLLFDIGVFPFLMVMNATLFFDPSWPRRFLSFRWGAGLRESEKGAPGPAFRVGAGVVALYCAFQILMPLRAHLYGGSVLWHEQGMRWSWRVMLRRKTGAITYRVTWAGREREQHVYPHQYLTVWQEQEMAGQPDLILALAHHIAEDYRARGLRDVEVRVHAPVSLNGRPAALMIDPSVDLTTVEDGLSAAEWILPSPDDPPLQMPGPRPAGGQPIASRRL